MDQSVLDSPLPLDQLERGLSSWCEEHFRAAGVPGASVAVIADRIGYHHAHGVKSSVTREPVTVDTAFDIGSCAKAFTSTAIAALAAEGKLSWDDPIARYVPELQLHDPWVTAHATLRDLSANRLGLPRIGLTEFGLDPSIDAAYVFQHLRHTAPSHPFRDRFTYVNAGHAANALAVGRVDGGGFLAALRRLLLEPLGMRHTSCGRAAQVELANQAGWHVLDEHGRAQEIPALFTDQNVGSASIKVSGGDALRWLRLHLNAGQVDGRQIVPQAALAETHHPHVPIWPGAAVPGFGVGEPESYALGWGVTQMGAHCLLAHSGSDYGVASFTLLAPRAGIGIAVYVNVLTHAARSAAYSLLRRLLGVPSAAVSVSAAQPDTESVQAMQSTTPLLPLSDYAGEYWHPADGPMRVVANAHGLSGELALGYQMTFTLTPRDGHRFVMNLTALHWRGFAADIRPMLDFDVRGGRVVGVRLVTPAGERHFARV